MGPAVSCDGSYHGTHIGLIPGLIPGLSLGSFVTPIVMHVPDSVMGYILGHSICPNIQSTTDCMCAWEVFLDSKMLLTSHVNIFALKTIFYANFYLQIHFSMVLTKMFIGNIVYSSYTF